MTQTMRMLLAVLLVAASGCAPSKYFYNFDVTDPGAKNLTKPGERDVVEDPDLRAELLGNAAASFDNQPFELVVPIEARGQPRDFRVHLLAHAVKL